MNEIYEIVKKFRAVPLEQFIDLTLFHRTAGYYHNRVSIGGKDGDFVTAPVLCSIFGEMIAIHVANYILEHDLCNVVFIECGAGDGQMIHDMLNVLQKLRDGDVIKRISAIWIVEISEKLLILQKKKLSTHSLLIQWSETVSAIPITGPAIFIGNEFLDAIPIRQYVSFNKLWHERLVAIDEHGELHFSYDPQSVPFDMEPYMRFIRHEHHVVKDGEIVELPLFGLMIMREIATIISQYGGLGIFIDYGYGTDQYASGSTIQAMRKNKIVDVLSEPGSCDVTHLVQFTLFLKMAQEIGLKAEIVTQRDFLIRCGIERRLASLQANSRLNAEYIERVMSAVDCLISVEKMGELFKTLIIHA